ncbi:MAG: hypothetical protein F9K29_00290 [Hyphomicrobiaceae bacterium]|nr:MAG: hypothetical protein F9K29_00290 [Hyphomicrobiaceae bacterium]
MGIALLSLLAALGLLSTAAAQTIDPHRVYEERCAKCHAPHAADFAREAMEAKDGKIVARQSRRELSAILPRHRGTQQTEAEVRALIDMFARNLSSGSLYQRKCIVCHDKARDFARSRLIIDQGALKGRYSGYLIEDFLQGHGRLTEAEVGQMVATLKWQVETREP